MGGTLSKLTLELLKTLHNSSDPGQVTLEVQRMPVRTLSLSEDMRFLIGVAVQPFVAAGLGFLAFPVFFT